MKTSYLTISGVKSLKKRFLLLTPLLYAVALLFGGQTYANEVAQLNGKTMGTVWQVKIAEPIPSEALSELNQNIEDRLQGVNLEMSTYIPNSLISQFNQRENTEPFDISPSFHRVMKKALQISAESEGLYDVTVLPLVNLWGFGPEKVSNQPSAEAIEEALRTVGYEQLTLTETTLQKNNPKTQIDLSSIAKGYGVDEVADVLEKQGIKNYLVEIGGELRASGNKYGSAWTVGIETPVPDSHRQVQQIIRLDNGGLATSGNYRNFIDFGGIRAVHTIHPKTGQPEYSQLLSATVVADNCMTADAYATALMVSGKQAEALVLKQNLSALLIYAEGEKGFRIWRSPKFIERFGEK